MYALATGLVGFSSSTLRVKVTEIRDGYAWVRTADLASAGVPLTIREDQLSPIDEPLVWRHKDGMLTFG